MTKSSVLILLQATVIALKILNCHAINGMPPEYFKEIAAKVHNECVGKVGVKEEVIAEARKGNFIEDEALKRFFHCAYHAFAQDVEGYSAEQYINLYPEEDRAKHAYYISKCGTVPGKDVYDSYFLTVKCYSEVSPQDFWIL